MRPGHAPQDGEGRADKCTTGGKRRERRYGESWTVKRVTRPMVGFKSFAATQCTLAGVELMHMLKKRRMAVEEGDEGLTPAEQFYALAASSPHRPGRLTPN